MRFVVVVLAAAALAACNPEDCGGAGFVSNQNPGAVVDNGAPAGLGTPLCSGTNTTTNGDVNISNQTELNQLAGCAVVVGNVSIQNSSDITDLSPLATLTRIDAGYLLLFNNSALTDAEFPVLTQAAYGIGIVQNPALTAANFPAVVEAFGDITVFNNAAITQLGFPALQIIRDDARFAGKADNAGNLIVGNNPAFTGFSTFTQLAEIQGFMTVFGNDALHDFTGLEALNAIDNDGKAAQGLAIGVDFDDDNSPIAAGNATLHDFTGFDELDTVNGDVFIGFNPALQNLNGVHDLVTINNNLFIVGNDTLQDLSGIEGDGGADGINDGLQIVKGSIFIGLFFDGFKQPRAGGNAQLNDLSGLDHLGELDGSLVVAFNPQMKTFNGLTVLPNIGGDLVILGGNLDDFSGADALTEVKGTFSIGQELGNDGQVLDKDHFLDVNGTASDPRTTVGLDVNNTGNTAFAALTTIDKDLIVAFSDPSNLRIADQLATVGGRLIIHDSDLPDLTGFESVTSLGGLSVGLAIDKEGNFHAGGNADFSSFNGLNVAGLLAGGLAIGFNNNLDNLSTLQVTSTTGSVTIVSSAFTSLNGFALTNIGGNFAIGAIVNGNEPPVQAGNDALTSLDVAQLGNVGGDVLVAFNQALTDAGFSALNTVGGKFEITADGALTNVAGSGNLGTAGSVLIHDLPAMTTLNLSGLTSTTADVQVTADDQLTTVNLNSLTNVGGTCEITFDANLPNLDFLSNLTTVGGSLLITDDPDVADVQGLASVGTVGGDVLIARDRSVQELDLGVTTVGGSFEVAQMDALVDLTHNAGTSLALSSVGDALRIRQNAGLTSLAGLENLTSVGLAVAIDDNPVLDTVLVDAGTRHAADTAGDVGLLGVTNVGNPNPGLVDENGNNATGDRGVIEAENNPLLDEAQLNKLIQGLTGFLGAQCAATDTQLCGLFFCGNQNQGGVADVDARFDLVTCGAQ